MSGQLPLLGDVAAADPRSAECGDRSETEDRPQTAADYALARLAGYLTGRP
jgi:hypothetical protein